LNYCFKQRLYRRYIHFPRCCCWLHRRHVLLFGDPMLR